MRKYLFFIALISISCHAFMASGSDLENRVVEYQLRNGMRWLIVQKKDAPVFAGSIMVRVGGADEVDGKTGIAHMFEHMAFKGSAKLGTKDFEKEKVLLQKIEDLGEKREELEAKGSSKSRIQKIEMEMKKLEKEADQLRVKNEVWEVLSRNGARGTNAYTAKDITSYFTSMPSNRLELWAKVFSEMIFEPSFREFYIERDVVADERRSFTESNPDGEMGEVILKAAFKDGPYHWSTIGFMDDINNLTIEDARNFHEKYYVASNMIGVIVGDVRIGKAKSVIRKVFGGYPKRPVPPSPKSAGTPLMGGMKKFHFDAERSLAIAYHKPTLPDKKEYVFDVITSLLCDGRSSRLRREFIYDRKMIQNLYCSDGYPGSRMDNLFLIWIDPMKGHSVSSVLSGVTGAIDRLSKEMPSGEELSRVQKQVSAGVMFSLESNMSLAQALGRFQSIFGDWRILASYPEEVSKVSANDVMDVAKRYMGNDKRIVVERLKK